MGFIQCSFLGTETLTARERLIVRVPGFFQFNYNPNCYGLLRTDPITFSLEMIEVSIGKKRPGAMMTITKQRQVEMLFQHWHTVLLEQTRTSDKNTLNIIALQQDPTKQINELLIRKGKCDWPLTGGAMIYCTCHSHLKVTFTLGWRDRSK